MKLKKNFKAGPIILIGLGVIFLLNNFGILSWDIWTNLWKFWPVIIILIGIEFIVGQSISFRSLVVVILLIFLIPIFLTFNPFTRNPLATNTLKISEPLGSLTRAKIIIDMPATNLTINALGNDTSKLVEGKVVYSKAVNKPEIVKQDTFGQEIFTLKQNITPGLPFISSLQNKTELSVTRQIPIEIQITTGASKESLDLTSLRVNYLEINSQASDLKISFNSSYSSNAKIKAKASNLDIKIPKEIEARIKITSPVKNISVDSRFRKNNDEYKSSKFDAAFIRVDIQIEAVASSISIK
ncbi:MAG: hypothetical protein A2172_04410 [Candidatus Woykebacteria bacterium RBG_13_40_15]|uniref:DUF5668 domain-containing protein n=1 Tax=Candidatus Woykebacteria bacterium RBG_13_40_15 TaxID=1802593 RepID=A0A1G1W6Y6_9BACT|nr:MAG: hypothetical protein A2172_04410 [Candidatus Woykebacteria bacterium RBG_13_40_15]